VNEPRKPTGVVIVSLEVSANPEVTVGNPSNDVGPEQDCVGGATAVNVQAVARDTAVAPPPPATSPLSLRSHDMKASVEPTPPDVMVPEFAADSVPAPTGAV
jgi:hypothetical protein